MTVRIGTHSGRFHADEALAIALLRRYLAVGTEVERSRDPAVWPTCDYLVDVGAVYDHDSRRYDHHQSSFCAYFPGRSTTLLSSAGLIYLHYGKQVVARMLGLDEGDLRAQLVYEKMYDKFVETFDAVDNGVERFDPGVTAKYAKPYDIFGMIADLNPQWNEEGIDEETIQERFMEAVELAGDAFDRHVGYYGKSWLPAREIIIESIGRSSKDPELVAAKTLLLPQNCPWKEHLFELEEQHQVRFLYCVYPDESGKGWRIQAVPVALDSFESRRALPEAWRGVRETDLDAIVGGRSGAVFVHKTGFIGGHREFAGIIRMAKLAAAEHHQPDEQ